MTAQRSITARQITEDVETIPIAGTRVRRLTIALALKGTVPRPVTASRAHRLITVLPIMAHADRIRRVHTLAQQQARALVTLAILPPCQMALDALQLTTASPTMAAAMRTPSAASRAQH